MIDKILEYNRRFVEEKGYERFITDKYPNKRIAIVTCMDTRLVELLPAALGFRNGDVKIIKNAGATITNPFDSTVRSLLVAIYELGVEEVMIIGHTECGVQGMDSAEMQHAMRERGIPEHHITLMKHCGIDLDSWLHRIGNPRNGGPRPQSPARAGRYSRQGLYHGLDDRCPATDRVAVITPTTLKTLMSYNTNL